jgi:DNA-binding Xre family transcriptional regulator
MPKPLTPEQLKALQAVPLGSMPNKLRIAIALTDVIQGDIAAETGIHASNLSDLINGKTQGVRLDTARRIAGFFCCAIEDLFPARQEVA